MIIETYEEQMERENVNRKRIGLPPVGEKEEDDQCTK